MSRRTFISLLAILVVLLGVAFAGVKFLYSGTGSARANVEVPDSQQYLLMPAVPVDAVVVGSFSNVEKVIPKILPSDGFVASLTQYTQSQALDIDQMVVSLHNLGRLYPLYVFDGLNFFRIAKAS